MENRTDEEEIGLYFDEKRNIYNNISRDKIMRFFEDVWKTYETQKTIYACGNGGNASCVSNLVNDLANHPFVSHDKSRPLDERIPRLKAYDLCASSAAISGMANDFGFRYVFSRQLVNNGISEGDLVFGISGSGNSENIIEAFTVAKKYRAKSLAFTRTTEKNEIGKIKDVADDYIIIPGTSKGSGQVGKNNNNFHFEDLVFEISHIITGLMCKRIVERYSDGYKSS